MNPAQRHDVVDKIVSDHHEFEDVFKELEKHEAAAQHRRDLVEHVIAGIVRHAVSEEQYVYPAARRVLENGDEIVEHEIEEHSKAEEVMNEIEKCNTEDPKFDELVDKLIDDIRHHIEDEEENLLPKLRQACDGAELQELGEKFETAKKMAPTRPHPMAPDRPPANRILGPGAGLVDRLRDALSGRNS